MTFQINKTSKLLQTKGVSLDVVQSEMRATWKFFLEYQYGGFLDAVTTAKEVAEAREIKAGISCNSHSKTNEAISV